MPFRHSTRGVVRRCRPYAFLPASALLLVALGCGEDSPTGPTATSTPEATPTSAASEFAVAANSWMTRRDMAERVHPAVATVPNSSGQSILYVIGGNNGSNLKRVQAYNVATNTWASKAALPMPVSGRNGAAAIGSKIYVPSGFKLYVYNTALNKWTEKRSMPEEGVSGFTGVIQKKLYVVLYCRDFDVCAFPQRWLFRYDPLTDNWETLATPPRSVEAAVGGAIGNKFYLGAFAESKIDVYDPATNTWTERTTNLPHRAGAASVVVGAKLYMIGGLQNGSPVRTTNVFDPGTNRWTSVAPTPTARSGASAARVLVNGQGRIELVGGSVPGNNLQYTP